ncbi:MAG: hypothetical protein Q8L45_08180 [Xanthomonadaceae bacterium]|nr:hypothetical protein [Xanthomonadaceae bacterium]MDP2186574.1 hypothetical protein [Xanthomonadales bacterium]MDZ4115622.1 hypothetical protein [Xanthomonadaceae bacterium]MDZ4378928.1 hypothetical protein [Xanthomonadaceae bacterium]
MTTNRNSNLTQDECPWENGTLGRDEAHVMALDAKTSRETDDATGLQMISIRLEKSLLRDLKEIAAQHGIGYQPMVRDLLHRFATAEIKTLLQERLREVMQAETSQGESVAPVEEFMARRSA